MTTSTAVANQNQNNNPSTNPSTGTGEGGTAQRGVRNLKGQGARLFQALVLFLLGTLALTTPVRALDLSKKLQFDIPAQPLATALIRFSEQTGLQFTAPAAQLDKVETTALHGQYTTETALNLLLKNTEFAFQPIDENTLAITTKKTANLTSAENSSLKGPEKIRLSQEDTEQEKSEKEKTTSEVPEGTSESGIQGVPEILVVGSKALNMDIKRSRDDIQPYVVFDRATIEKSGVSNIQDFLKQRLTAATNPESGSQNAGTDGNVSVINLRGLGASQTLILVDGRRTAGFGDFGAAHQPDLNGIPMAAIERIEVLPTTASGIYGGSATGGVVNVVLRRDYRGVESRLTYGNTFDGEAATRRIDLTAGFNFEDGRTNLMLAGSYADDSPLKAGERDFVRRARALRLRNDPASLLLGASTPPLGATTNICAGFSFFGFSGCSGAPLTLKDATPLNSSITFVPEGYGGFVTEGDAGQAFLANAGQYNLDLANTAQAGGARQDIVNAPTVESLIVTLRREFSSRIDGFIDAQISNNTGYHTSNTGGAFFIPASAPTNPFSEDIVVSTPVFGADDTFVTRLYDRKLGAGVIVELAKDWRATVNYTWDRTRRAISQARTIGFDALTFDPIVVPDLASGALDVLRDTNASSVDFSSYLLAPAVIEPTHTTLNDATLRLSGSLGRLPGGPIALAGLIEHRKEVIDRFVQTSSFLAGVAPTEAIWPSRSQTVDSVSLELNVPLVSQANRLPAVHSLDLQLAGRYDDYETVGANSINSSFPVPVQRATNQFSSMDPTVGLRYQPIEDVTLRASYGTGFLPASLNVLVPNPESILDDFTASFLQDPARNGEVLGSGIRLLSGGNPNLRPEESNSHALGIILTPRIVPGLRLSVDWSKIEKTDNVGVLALQEAINNDSFVPGLIVRTAPEPGAPNGVGRITEIHNQAVNVARQEFEGYDLAFEYRWDVSALGSFGIAAEATRQLHNESQLTPLAPNVESIGFVSGLKWKGNATLSFDRGPWSLAWTARYFDSYRVGFAGFPTDFFVAQQGSETYPSQTYHDFFVGYRFDAATTGLLSGVEIQLTVKNVFDESPPIDAVTIDTGYSTWGDPRLANYILSLKKAF